MLNLSDSEERILNLSMSVVCSYVRSNHLRPFELVRLIESTHLAFDRLGKAPGVTAPVEIDDRRIPAVPIKRSITPHAIICLEDGKAFKSMRRHLSATYG